MPKLTTPAWRRLVDGSVVDPSALRRALRHSVTCAQSRVPLLVLVAGPSASGKSLLLRQVERMAKSLGAGAFRPGGGAGRILAAHSPDQWWNRNDSFGEPIDGIEAVHWLAVPTGDLVPSPVVARRTLEAHISRGLDVKTLYVGTKCPRISDPGLSGDLDRAELLEMLCWIVEAD